MSIENPEQKNKYSEADLEREIQEFKEKRKHDLPGERDDKYWRRNFLNNLFTKLPGGFSRNILESVAANAGPELQGEVLKERRLIEAIDKFIQDSGVPSDLIEEWMSVGGLEREYAPEEFVEFLSNLYINLRQSGFSHQEIIA